MNSVALENNEGKEHDGIDNALWEMFVQRTRKMLSFWQSSDLQGNWKHERS